jgi:hypothetical protein
MPFSVVNFDEVAKVGGEFFRSVINDIMLLLFKSLPAWNYRCFEQSPEIGIGM